MTPRPDVDWVDVEDEPQGVRVALGDGRRDLFPVCRGDVDQVVGFVHAEGLLARSVAGVVTIDDVLAALAGEIPQPGEGAGELPVQRDDGSWLVDGQAPIVDVAAALDAEFVEEEQPRYQTHGGFVMARLGQNARAPTCSWALGRAPTVNSAPRLRRRHGVTSTPPIRCGTMVASLRSLTASLVSRANTPSAPSPA